MTLGDIRLPAKTLFPDDPVNRVAKSVFGINYVYPWQRLIIAAVLDAADVDPKWELNEYPEVLRQIAVLPTGAGKSLCWMLPAVLLRGISVAVFPLLSLMADQKRRLDESGVPSVVLRGGQSPTERQKIWTRLESGDVTIVLANPEVLQVAKIRRRLGRLKPAFFVVDETHTVSQWGESFRPACAGMGRLVEEWNPRAVLALTATAGPHIRKRITALLFNGEVPGQALADPDRPAIRYGVLPSLSRFHSLEKLIRDQPRPSIVFGPTRSSVERAARVLRFRLKDDRIRYYHAGLSTQEKSRLEYWFMKSSDAVLCATCAYGMGVDKSNIRTVIHLAPPSSVEAYLQESGRASRDGLGAEAWLIVTPEDVLGDLQRYSFAANEGTDPLSQTALEGDSGGSASAFQAGRAPSPSLSTTHQPQPPDAESVAHARRAAMVCYAASTDRCRREMLLEALGIEAQDCSGCDICGGGAWTEAPEREIIYRVVRWNRGRFRKGQLARILIGRRTAEIRRTGLDLVRGFGVLSGWELEDAEEAVDSLLHTGDLVHRRFIKSRGVAVSRRIGSTFKDAL